MFRGQTSFVPSMESKFTRIFNPFKSVFTSVKEDPAFAAARNVQNSSIFSNILSSNFGGLFIVISIILFTVFICYILKTGILSFSIPDFTSILDTFFFSSYMVLLLGLIYAFIQTFDFNRAINFLTSYDFLVVFTVNFIMLSAFVCALTLFLKHYARWTMTAIISIVSSAIFFASLFITSDLNILGYGLLCIIFFVFLALLTDLSLSESYANHLHDAIVFLSYNFKTVVPFFLSNFALNGCLAFMAFSVFRSSYGNYFAIKCLLLFFTVWTSAIVFYINSIFISAYIVNSSESMNDKNTYNRAINSTFKSLPKIISFSSLIAFIRTLKIGSVFMMLYSSLKQHDADKKMEEDPDKNLTNKEYLKHQKQQRETKIIMESSLRIFKATSRLDSLLSKYFTFSIVDSQLSPLFSYSTVNTAVNTFLFYQFNYLSFLSILIPIVYSCFFYIVNFNVLHRIFIFFTKSAFKLKSLNFIFSSTSDLSRLGIFDAKFEMVAICFAIGLSLVIGCFSILETMAITGKCFKEEMSSEILKRNQKQEF